MEAPLIDLDHVEKDYGTGPVVVRALIDVDLRIAKVLRFGGRRAQVGIDIFNAMNSNVAQGYLQTFGTTWLRPTSVMDARFARVSGQIDF